MAPSVLGYEGNEFLTARPTEYQVESNSHQTLPPQPRWRLVVRLSLRSRGTGSRGRGADLAERNLPMDRCGIPGRRLMSCGQCNYNHPASVGLSQDRSVDGSV